MQFELNLEEKSSEDIKLEYLKKSIEETRKQSENVRKGLFARHNELAKMYVKQQQEIESLKNIIWSQMPIKQECWTYLTPENKLFELKEFKYG